MPAALPDLYSYGAATGRWSRLGPYYAMFPLALVDGVLDLFAKPGQTVIDPFCGRGTVPYVAMTKGIWALACDLNPVAWLYARTKTDPHPNLEEVKQRISGLQAISSPDEAEVENEFQELAFCLPVLAFINTARRELDWRNSRLDRTVAAFLVQHLHDKRGSGLSNQMRHSRSLAPRYCVDWWQRNGFETPPLIDAEDFLHRRADWRYAKGTPQPISGNAPEITLGDAGQRPTRILKFGRSGINLSSIQQCNQLSYRQLATSMGSW